MPNRRSTASRPDTRDAEPRDSLTTAQAAERLGVKPDTLYAYVSRGLLRSERGPDGRASRFDPAEVARFAARGRRSAPPPPAEPGITTSLTAITPEGVFYRGASAAMLSRSRTFEEVAEWLWTGESPGRAVWRADPVAIIAGAGAQTPLPAQASPLDRLRVIAAAVATTDDLRFDLRPEAVTVAARSLLAAMVDCLPRLRPELAGPLSIGGALAPAGTLAARLWVRLCDSAPTPAMLDALNAAMVLLADHELAASTLAARVAASVRADPYAVVLAGLGVVSGALHGGASRAAESLLDELDQGGGAMGNGQWAMGDEGATGNEQPQALGRPGLAVGDWEGEVVTASGLPAADVRLLGERLRRGEQVPGFGQPLYPGGDPRAVELLGRLRGAAPDSRRLVAAEALIETMRERGLPPPNVDFALASLTHAAGMAPGAGEAIFAVSRAAGWIAHALEEYAHRTVFRPRATYAGPRFAE